MSVGSQVGRSCCNCACGYDDDDVDLNPCRTIQIVFRLCGNVSPPVAWNKGYFSIGRHVGRVVENRVWIVCLRVIYSKTKSTVQYRPEDSARTQWSFSSIQLTSFRNAWHLCDENRPWLTRISGSATHCRRLHICWRHLRRTTPTPKMTKRSHDDDGGSCAPYPPVVFTDFGRCVLTATRTCPRRDVLYISVHAIAVTETPLLYLLHYTTTTTVNINTVRDAARKRLTLHRPCTSLTNEQTKRETNKEKPKCRRKRYGFCGELYPSKFSFGVLNEAFVFRWFRDDFG